MKVGVIGAGTMGQGIAKAFAQTEGFTVALCDIKQEWADKGKDKIAAGYAKLVAKGKLDQAEVDRRMAAITAGLKEDLCADCDLIVEAAFEDMKVKQTTFGELDKICKPECVFASNTSSLSITEIGKGLTRPLVGMHFFNPADRMKLIEVIAGGGGNQVDILNGLLQHGGALGQILRNGSALRHHQILAVRNGDQLVPAGAFIHGKLFGVLQRVAAFHGKGGGSRAAAARAAGQQQKRCGRKCGTKPKTFRLHYSAGVSVALSKVRV